MSDIALLEPGEELDALVAEKVMGWDVHFRLKLGERPHHEGREHLRDPEHNTVYLPEQWCPSSDITAAFEVVSKVGIGLTLHWVPDQKNLDVYGGAGSWVAATSGIAERAETAPLAICRWALKTLKHESTER